jgi:serine-type D-Ala-D-Ala carboxypeptidase
VQERMTRVSRLIQQYIDAGEIDGAGLVVQHAGEPVIEWYAGQAAPNLPAGPQVLWPLASISKLYTAAAVMSLVEDGELTLSMRVSDVLPEFRTELRSETRLWHLLTHTSGMMYESPEMEQLLADQTPLGEMIDEAFNFSPLANPGTRLEYSDYGIALAGRVAELVSRVSLSDLVRQRVIDPAGLSDTFFPPSDSEYERIARVRDVPATGTPGEMYNSGYCRQLAHPSFGVVASARDLLNFGLLFHPRAQHQVLSRATTQSMTRDQLNGGLTGRLVGLELHDPQPWGLGFMVKGESFQLGFGELASSSAFGHPGATGCVLLIDPVHDVSLSFVSNRHASSGFERFLFREASVTNAVLAALT